MSDSITATVEGRKTTASTASENDANSSVTVISGGYSLTFSGNNFEAKHLRRIRKSSITDLKTGENSKVAKKLNNYVEEANKKSARRWENNEQSTNTLVFLDLSGYCQLGGKIIKVIDDTNPNWQIYRGNAQTEIEVALEKCLTFSSNGIGQIKTEAVNKDRLQCGVGVTLKVTIQKENNANRILKVVHLAGATVKLSFGVDTKIKAKSSKSFVDQILS